MKKYEYILLDCDEKASKDEVLKNLEDKSWISFNSKYITFEAIVKNLLRDNCTEWGIYDEDDGVCIAIKAADSEAFQVWYVQPWYIFTTTSRIMFDADDFNT